MWVLALQKQNSRHLSRQMSAGTEPPIIFVPVIRLRADLRRVLNVFNNNNNNIDSPELTSLVRLDSSSVRQKLVYKVKTVKTSQRQENGKVTRPSTS